MSFFTIGAHGGRFSFTSCPGESTENVRSLQREWDSWKVLIGIDFPLPLTQNVWI